MLLNKNIIWKVGYKILYNVDLNRNDFNICSYPLGIFMENTREAP